MDEHDFDSLYERSASRLVGMTFAACGDLQEAQDCVQEAFVRAWARRAHLDPGQVEAWLRVVALRIAVSRWRRRRGLDRFLARAGSTPPPPEPDGLRVDVQRALAALPPRTRTVLVLHYLADQPVEAIAQQTATPIGTVKSRLARGRQALSATLRTSDTLWEADHA